MAEQNTIPRACCKKCSGPKKYRKNTTKIPNTNKPSALFVLYLLLYYRFVTSDCSILGKK